MRWKATDRTQAATTGSFTLEQLKLICICNDKCISKCHLRLWFIAVQCAPIINIEMLIITKTNTSLLSSIHKSTITLQKAPRQA